ncbi:MAG TPA: lysophospholipid acyltransferase family protein [Acidimicrobiales bacterium]|nr:lysophospholipid acyltransferase family protein [Acidimicrobiales bacterium]
MTDGRTEERHGTDALPAERRGTDLLPLRLPAEPESVGTRHGDVDEWGRSERTRQVLRRLYGGVYSHWFRAEWEGLEKIPTAGGALLVANHAGAIPADAPTIMHGIETELERPVYGLADYFFRAMPVVGTMWSRGGGVAAHPDNAYRILHDDHQLVLVFPEGTKATGKYYSQRYQLSRFGRGGFVEIAMRAGVPVVPIAVVGGEETMPMIAKSSRLAKLLRVPYAPLTANMLVFGPAGLVIPFPAKMRFRVLDPVHFDVDADQERYPRSRILNESEEIRNRMQTELYDMLRQRRSVWFG